MCGNNLSVTREYNGTTLAAHNTATTVYAYRTLTIERGANGSTAATHLISAAISRYAPPDDVARIVRAAAIMTLQEDLAAWGREIGTGDAGREFQGTAYWKFRATAVESYRFRAIGAV